MKDAIRNAIRDHVKAGHKVADPDGLVARIREALGDRDDVWEYAGWRVTRKTGKELKVRGDGRYANGWEAVHVATGFVEAYEPSSAKDVPVEMVTRGLDLLNQIYAKLGSFRP